MLPKLVFILLERTMSAVYSIQSRIILDLNKIDAPLGNIARAYLIINDNLLFFNVSGGLDAHKRVPKTDICSKTRGEYDEVGPYLSKKT